MCLRSKVENGCELTENFISHISFGSEIEHRLDCLKYLVEKDCPINIKHSLSFASDPVIIEYLNSLKKLK